MYIKATENFEVKSPLGLHARPSARLVRAFREYLDKHYIESVDVANGHPAHFDLDTLPDLTYFTRLGLHQGAELEISVNAAKKEYKDNLFRRIKRILDKSYVKNEERTLPLHVMGSN